MIIYFQRNGFTLEVMPIIGSVIQSTVNLYRSAITSLAPTPAKSHYFFNLRDISKVTNGILMFRKESFTNRKVFVRYDLSSNLMGFNNNYIVFILDCGYMK